MARLEKSFCPMSSGPLVEHRRSLCRMRNFETSGAPRVQAEQPAGTPLKEGDGGSVRGWDRGSAGREQSVAG